MDVLSSRKKSGSRLKCQFYRFRVGARNDKQLIENICQFRLNLPIKGTPKPARQQGWHFCFAARLGLRSFMAWVWCIIIMNALFSYEETTSRAWWYPWHLHYCYDSYSYKCLFSFKLVVCNYTRNKPIRCCGIYILLSVSFYSKAISSISFRISTLCGKTS